MSLLSLAGFFSNYIKVYSLMSYLAQLQGNVRMHLEYIWNTCRCIPDACERYLGAELAIYPSGMTKDPIWKFLNCL